MLSISDCAWDFPGEVVFEHDLQLGEKYLTDPEDVCLWSCGQDQRRVGVETDADLPIGLVGQPDNHQWQIGGVEFLGMVVPGHDAIDLRDIGAAEKLVA